MRLSRNGPPRGENYEFNYNTGKKIKVMTNWSRSSSYMMADNQTGKMILKYVRFQNLDTQK